ncbi:hypothetical protein FRB93_000038 [Tulasnella sp. JGI-2019a]|nr:hypothetical protein FRB93_000038 [Tulasnella sp. JGI-2019a]
MPPANFIWPDLITPWLFAPVTKLLGLIVLINVLGKLARKFVFVPTLTILDDLPNFAQKRKDDKIAGRAVICGGSVAGLISAAVCSLHFDSVLVIEPEGGVLELGMDIPKERQFRTLPNGLQTLIPLRKRVAQYLAPHVFMPPLILGLERLFPEALKPEMAYFGFSFAPLSYSFNYGNRASPLAFTTTDPKTPRTLPIMRPSFETLLRRLVVKTCGNVTFMVGTVDGFTRHEEDSNKISGVSVRESDPITGDFIIDATGSAQLSYHKWLKNAGFGPLPPSLHVEYNPQLTYSQSIYKIPKNLLPKIEAILPKGLIQGPIYANTPDSSTGERRTLYLFLHEDQQVMLMCGGRGLSAEDRPLTASEFRTYTKSLHHSEVTPGWIYELFDILEAHEAECDAWYAVVHPGKLAYIKYHEAESGALPSNWVAIGDSMVKLNPIYGQGCGKAMMDVVALDKLLRGLPSRHAIPDGFSTKFFRKAITRTQGMWNNNKAHDYGWQTTEPAKGETLENGAFLREFSRNLLYAGEKCHSLHATFMLTSWGMAPKTDLFAPSILARVGWQWLTDRWN